MQVLLEVVLQRHVDERPAVRRQLHASGQPTLDDRQIACRQVPEQLRHVAVVRHPLELGQHAWVDARTGDHHEADALDEPPGGTDGIELVGKLSLGIDPDAQPRWG